MTNTRGRMLLPLVAALALSSGCGSSSARSDPPEASKPSTTENGTCVGAAQKWLDSFDSLRKANGGTAEDLENYSDALATAYKTMNTSCSRRLIRVAADADEAVALAALELEVCEVKPKQCAKRQKAGGDQLRKAVARAEVVQHLVHPTS